MMMTDKKQTSRPLMLPLIITALLFSASACSNPSAVNTNADLTEYKEGKASVSESIASMEKPAFTTKSVATFNEP